MHTQQADQLFCTLPSHILSHGCFILISGHYQNTKAWIYLSYLISNIICNKCFLSSNYCIINNHIVTYIITFT